MLSDNQDEERRAIEAGFKWPVAVTQAVWNECVTWSDSDRDNKVIFLVVPTQISISCRPKFMVIIDISWRDIP